MKKLLLAALATVALGVGAASAQTPHHRGHVTQQYTYQYDIPGG